MAWREVPILVKIAVMVVNGLILYNLWWMIKQDLIRRKNAKIKIKNLLHDKITIAVSEEENKMLRKLTSLNYCSTGGQYIRKELIKQFEVT